MYHLLNFSIKKDSALYPPECILTSVIVRTTAVRHLGSTRLSQFYHIPDDAYFSVELQAPSHADGVCVQILSRVAVPSRSHTGVNKMMCYFKYKVGHRPFGFSDQELFAIQLEDAGLCNKD
jgi:hypothetical protein